MRVVKRMLQSGFDKEVRLLSMADTFESLSEGVIEELDRRGCDIRLEAGEVFFTSEEEHKRGFSFSRRGGY